MPVPFGNHPALGQYIDWIIECGGTSQSGYAHGQNYTKITTAEGRHAFVVGTDQNERLVPTMVSYLDRRLNVTSPWHPPD
jgi:hypothetical protein